MAKGNGRNAAIFQDPFGDSEGVVLPAGHERAAEPAANRVAEPDLETGTGLEPERVARAEAEAGLEAEPALGQAAELEELLRLLELTEEAEEPAVHDQVGADVEEPASFLEQAPEPRDPGLPQAAADAERPGNLLDGLIAAIDMEVEEAFGAGAMAELMSAAPVAGAGEEQHVIFALAETEYAAHVGNVTEIRQPPDTTPVPSVPDWVLGVANLRGDIISIVDMRMFLGMEPTGHEQGKRMLVAQARGEELTAGLIVDRVSGIRYLDVKQIGAPAAPVDDQVAPYMRGVYEHDGRLLVVLDLNRLLLSHAMRAI